MGGPGSAPGARCTNRAGLDQPGDKMRLTVMALLAAAMLTACSSGGGSVSASLTVVQPSPDTTLEISAGIVSFATDLEAMNYPNKQDDPTLLAQTSCASSAEDLKTRLQVPEAMAVAIKESATRNGLCP
jgi:hypothetical protein